STDRRVAAWRYASDSSAPWASLEHPQEVTVVRFCYAPPPPATTHYQPHHLYTPPAADSETAGPPEGAAPVPPAHLQQQQQQHHPPGHAVRPDAVHLPGGGCTDPYGTQAEGLPAGSPYDPHWEDWVVSGCVDGAMRLWHLPSRQLLRVLSGHADVVWGMSALYGSSVLVSSSRDGTTKLWQLPPYAVMQAAVALPAGVEADEEAAAPAAPGGADAGGGAGGGGAGGAGGAGGGGGAEDGGAPPRAAAEPLEAMATLCGHSSAVLCMDAHRAPPGLVPRAAPPRAAGAEPPGGSPGGVVSAAGGAAARPEEVLAVHADMLASLTHLLNTSLVAPPPPPPPPPSAPPPPPAARRPPSPLYGGGGGGGALAGVSRLDKAAAAAAAAAGALPTWLVATGGADAVVRVWDLGSARCVCTLRGHTVGVLSVKFGHLPARTHPGDRNAPLLPPDLDVSSAAPPPPLTGLALPPGQYGAGIPTPTSTTADPNGGLVLQQRQRQVLPPCQRLVLVTGSVREVRVWDPVAGVCLAQLADHSGPVTTITMVHGVLVTLAMNDGLIAYRCNGLEDPVHHAFAAALAAHLEGLAVGSGTGDITYLDFRPRASPFPNPSSRQPQQQLRQMEGRSAFLLRF
ncbi:hypothetical protein TSOC_001107, partial [Tetrabaena socialis]